MKRWAIPRDEENFFVSSLKLNSQGNGCFFSFADGYTLLTVSVASSGFLPKMAILAMVYVHHYPCGSANMICEHLPGCYLSCSSVVVMVTWRWVGGLSTWKKKRMPRTLLNWLAFWPSLTNSLFFRFRAFYFLLFATTGQQKEFISCGKWGPGFLKSISKPFA
jgi:hypothetical protein